MVKETCNTVHLDGGVPRTCGNPERTDHREGLRRPDGGAGESRGGSTGGILQAEVAECEAEPLYNELVWAMVGTHAG